MAKLITAGCGISHLKFDKWPTWPKYCVLTHECEHHNLGGPAAGNEHIARSINRSIYEQQPDAVIVTWTSYNKLDVYVEDCSKAEQIKSFPSRNFLIDYQGKTTDAPAWWPSSVSYDNPIKESYRSTIESKTYHYIRTLESIISVQNLCQLKEIPCYMFLSYEFEFDYIKNHNELKYLYNAIDWEAFSDLTPLETAYEKSQWFNYSTTKSHGMVPVAGWHYEFYVKQIVPLLSAHFNTRNLDKFYLLEQEILEITNDRYSKGIS